MPANLGGARELAPWPTPGRLVVVPSGPLPRDLLVASTV